MNRYETLFVLIPTLDEEGVKANIEKFKGVIEQGGTVSNIDEWGKRRLAYEINDIGEGFYILINFKANPDLPKELDRIFRISDAVLRHIIINLDEK
ncbi:30S ribosomal protein S6 [Oxobacter pfennigii]|uniref:Small ribosomal subunit protein bS6 n=1 Tax=Oxobacter pfennigii TaxID=36849 RepID=A0A0P8Y898_9CLOT|nr:30S ribosomal protein S6 [Oxobacter pfennigii]KPU42905.1 30S ribosomal protein S6 [Oxobacter pfennigii]